jgi:REP-associated tyrosine transposase
MPRAPRISFAGALYHVTTRGNRRCDIYRDDEDRRWFLLTLARAVRGASWRCHAYCLMGNHYHLLVETPEETISRGMQILNGRYARDFNWKYGLKGHLFERRFHAELVEDHAYLLEVSRYIVLNPVRAGICAGPESWPWSSYRATAGEAPAPAFLTVDWTSGLFGTSPTSAREQYAAFVADRVTLAVSGARHWTRPV